MENEEKAALNDSSQNIMSVNQRSELQTYNHSVHLCPVWPGIHTTTTLRIVQTQRFHHSDKQEEDMEVGHAPSLPGGSTKERKYHATLIRRA